MKKGNRPEKPVVEVTGPEGTEKVIIAIKNGSIDLSIEGRVFFGGLPSPVFFFGQFLDGLIFTNRYTKTPRCCSEKNVFFVDKREKGHFKMTWGFPGLVLPGYFYGLWMLELGVKKWRKERSSTGTRMSGWLMLTKNGRWTFWLLRMNHLIVSRKIIWTKPTFWGSTSWFCRVFSRIFFVKKNSSDFPVVYLKFSAFAISGEVNDDYNKVVLVEASNTRSFPIKTKGQNIRVPGIYDRVLIKYYLVI